MVPDPSHTNDGAATGERLFAIGEAAQILGISVPTLRLYEREGLILPMRKPSGHRLYTDSDLDRVRCIRRTINELKISIEGMRRLLAIIPCWRILNCPSDLRVVCPAYLDAGRPCWSVRDRVWDCSTADCRECSVYRHADCSTVKSTVAHFMLTHPHTPQV